MLMHCLGLPVGDLSRAFVCADAALSRTLCRPTRASPLHLPRLSSGKGTSTPRFYRRLATAPHSIKYPSLLTKTSQRPVQQRHRPLKPSVYSRSCSYQRNMCKFQAAESPSAAVDVSKGREILPTNVKPLHYDLTLEPNFETFKYEGTVVIE